MSSGTVSLPLVVLGAHDARERMDAREFLVEAQEVALELGGTVPVVEGERGTPHLPEISSEEMLGEDLVDAAGSQ